MKRDSKNTVLAQLSEVDHCVSGVFVPSGVGYTGSHRCTRKFSRKWENSEQYDKEEKQNKKRRRKKKNKKKEQKKKLTLAHLMENSELPLRGGE